MTICGNEIAWLGTNWLGFLLPASLASVWFQMVQAKTFCLAHGQLYWIWLHGWWVGQKEPVSTKQVKKYNKKSSVCTEALCYFTGTLQSRPLFYRWLFRCHLPNYSV